MISIALQLGYYWELGMLWQGYLYWYSLESLLDLLLAGTDSRPGYWFRKQRYWYWFNNAAYAVWRRAQAGSVIQVSAVYHLHILEMNWLYARYAAMISSAWSAYRWYEEHLPECSTLNWSSKWLLAKPNSQSTWYETCCWSLYVIFHYGFNWAWLWLLED